MPSAFGHLSKFPRFSDDIIISNFFFVPTLSAFTRLSECNMSRERFNHSYPVFISMFWNKAFPLPNAKWNIFVAIICFLSRVTHAGSPQPIDIGCLRIRRRKRKSVLLPSSPMAMFLLFQTIPLQAWPTCKNFVCNYNVFLLSDNGS